MNRPLAVLTALVLVAAPGSAADAPRSVIKLSVQVPAAAGRDVPVCAKIDLPPAMKGVDIEKASVTMTSGDTRLPGQIVLRGKQADLWWVMPEASPGTASWTAAVSAEPGERTDTFRFRDAPGKHLDLLFAGRPVTRYMYALDRSSKERIFETYKPYHHVFDATGKDVITKDAHGHDPHHRGIYIGWGKTTCGGTSYNFWSMGRGEAQAHREFLTLAAGPVLGRMVSRVEWIGKDGTVVVAERREATCFRQSARGGLLLMEFRSDLTAVAGDVTLDANPEHGGFQYRAHNDVAVNVGAARGKQTADRAPEDLKTIYAFHRDGIKTSGQSLKDNKDLPWAAQCAAIRDKRYSVQHLNHPSNPSPTVYSAYRQYGRFGAFFKTTITKGKTLALVYRIYAAEGTMPPREEMNRRHAAFVTPPVATVVK